MPPIKKVNRTYKKGKPFRDARKFIIICEGERESNYFDFFNGKSKKFIVETVAPVGENQGESAPNHLKNRAIEYIDKNGWELDYDDQLWFVLDVDKWERTSIDELKILSDSTKNWFLAISNICFEVWLYYHKSKEKIIPKSSGDMKQLLHNQVNGGYKIEAYAPEILTATENSKNIDENEEGAYPDLGVTKVYKLGQEIVGLIQKIDGQFKLL